MESDNQRCSIFKNVHIKPTQIAGLRLYGCQHVTFRHSVDQRADSGSLPSSGIVELRTGPCRAHSWLPNEGKMPVVHACILRRDCAYSRREDENTREQAEAGPHRRIQFSDSAKEGTLLESRKVQPNLNVFRNSNVLINPSLLVSCSPFHALPVVAVLRVAILHIIYCQRDPLSDFPTSQMFVEGDLQKRRY